MADEKKPNRTSREPYYRLENNTASYLFDDEVCVWGDDGVLKIGAVVQSRDSDPYRDPDMRALRFSLKEATKLANTIIETVYIIREERAKKFMNMIHEEAEKLDPETCKIWYPSSSFYFDPYEIYGYRRAFLQCDHTEKLVFVQNIGSKVAISEKEIPKEKLTIINKRLSEMYANARYSNQEENNWDL